MKPVTQAEFARMTGVNRSTVTRWIQNGRIAVDALGLIDPVAANAMREDTASQQPHHQARKAGFELAKTPAGAVQHATSMQPLAQAIKNDPAAFGAIDDAALDDPSAADVNGRYKLAMAREREAKAELAAMEVDKLSRILVERSEVDYVLADLGNTLRSTFESLPDRLAGQLAALRGDSSAMHKALEDALRDVLASIAEQMKRRMDGVGQ